jgi:F-type H+-transporting ATPase subunit a
MSSGHHTFTWLGLVPGLDHVPSHVSHLVLVGAGLAGATWVARRQVVRAMSRPDGGLVPANRMTYQNFFEIVSERLYGFVESVLGSHLAHTHFSLIGSTFLLIFTCNLLGLIPGFLPPTDNLNTTLALGIVSFLAYNYVGIRENGIAYFKHFMGPVLPLAPLILAIEVFSHLFRPLTLGLRLRGNIMADHTILGVFSEMVPLIVPVIFYGFGLFVAFVQAFVFTLLTMVYLSLAAEHEH